MHLAIRLLGLVMLSVLAAVLTGCAGPAPNYAPSIDNVEMLRKTGATPTKTGSVAVASGLKTANAIQLRANTMVSGVGNHFGDYIAAALQLGNH